MNPRNELAETEIALARARDIADEARRVIQRAAELDARTQRLTEALLTLRGGVEDS